MSRTMRSVSETVRCALLLPAVFVAGPVKEEKIMTIDDHDLAAVSESALSRIASHGWVKFVSASDGEDGPMCLGGVLTYVLTGAVGFNSQQIPVYIKTAQIICDQFPDRVTHPFANIDTLIVNFNDHPNTTLADVCAVLEKLGAG